MQTFWLNGPKKAYIEHAGIRKSKSDTTDDVFLSDYHPTMYEIKATEDS